MLQGSIWTLSPVSFYPPPLTTDGLFLIHVKRYRQSNMVRRESEEIRTLTVEMEGRWRLDDATRRPLRGTGANKRC